MSRTKVGAAVIVVAALAAVAYFQPWRYFLGGPDPDPEPEPVVPEPAVVELRERLADEIGGSALPIAAEMTDELTRMMDACPAIEQHLLNVLTTGGANIYFSDVAKDATYSAVGDSTRNIPAHVIVLPSATDKSAADLVDAFLFETCNAKIQAKFDALAVERRDKLAGDPMSAIEYGQKKATIEAETVLEHTKLLIQARTAGAEISYQGNRNLLTMLKTCLSLKGEAIEDFDAVRDDPDRAHETLLAHQDTLHAFLMGTEEDEDARAALLGPIINTPHKREAVEAWDTGKLTTKDLYAYELLESWTVPNVAAMMTPDINAAFAGDPAKQDAVNAYIQARLELFDFGDVPLVGVDEADQPRDRTHDARVGMIVEVIKELKVMFPDELGGRDFATVGLTDDMAAVADARRAQWMTDPPSLFAKRLRDRLDKNVGELTGALSGLTTFTSTAGADLQKDVRPVVETLKLWREADGISALIDRIESAQAGDPPCLDSATAGSVAEGVSERIGAVFGPYGEVLMAINFEEDTDAAIAEGIAKLNVTVAAMPAAIRGHAATEAGMVAAVARDLAAIADT